MRTAKRDGTPRPAVVAGRQMRGFLEPCVLLLLNEGPAHGYELIERLGPFGFDRMDSGHVYRTLQDLQVNGLVRSWWEESRGAPPRRVYHLTAPGKERLGTQAAVLRRNLRMLERFSRRLAGTLAADRAAG